MAKNHKTPSRIIISRTDSIGDVVLTLPLAGALKEMFPAATLIFLGRNYTREVVALSADVDEFADWDEVRNATDEQALTFLRNLKADLIIHVFPQKRIAELAHKAGIPLRIGSAHRLYHWPHCNAKVFFSRRRSRLHESQLNMKLLRPLGKRKVPPLYLIAGYLQLNRPALLRDEIKDLIDNSRFNLIIHPGSRGSAREWGEENFTRLIEILPDDKFKIFITGTAQEAGGMSRLLQTTAAKATNLTGRLSLAELLGFISNADGLVACSTGPLHMAGILGKYAIGIFPPIRPMHPGRWAPLGPNASVIVAGKNCSRCRKSGVCECIRSITPEDVKERLMEIFST